MDLFPRCVILFKECSTLAWEHRGDLMLFGDVEGVGVAKLASVTYVFQSASSSLL